MSVDTIISAARGNIPVDTLFKDVQLVNLLSAEIVRTSVAVFNGKIVGFGDYDAEVTIDGAGLFLAPGLIDGHVHLESSMLSPEEFARAVVPMGTTAVIADPHEIVNVMSIDGLQYMLDVSAELPLDVYFMLPSCVPATHLETAGAIVTAADMRKWIDNPRILGIGEMMNFPGVLFGDSAVLEKLAVAGKKNIDGHAPLVRDKDLSAYISAGIRSDHESTNIDEAREKLQKGMFLMIREGSAARNLQDLLPLVTPLNSRNCGFVTDDRHPDFLLDFGHINSMVRDAVAFGIDPIIALQMASMNTARHFGLKTKGAIAPGYDADLILFDNFINFSIKMVFKNGCLVAENGRTLSFNKSQISELPRTIRVKDLSVSDLSVRATGKMMNVIDIVPNQLLTKKVLLKCQIADGFVVSDPDRDVLKMAVVERHHASGNIGLGFTRGIGLKSGAIASTVAHDSHNIIVIGANDEDMLFAINEIRNMNGGQVVVENGKALASLALPIAGLMSDKPLLDVRNATDILNKAARRLGCQPENPFMTLSFLSLPVIPELKLTDRGLVDVTKFDFIPLFADA
ncbi:MAG: adenine deaminase [Candidatus Marinimicrobia bacterium]|nr:adenine deaminase [Candidatus Neomarinimicrobiota bacterium]